MADAQIYEDHRSSDTALLKFVECFMGCWRCCL